MSINIVSTHNRLTKKQIVSLEKEIGYKIPLEYCEFLLYNNVARPENNIYIKDCFNVSVDFFLGISNNEIEDILQVLEFYYERIPLNYFPIAVDGIGNLICINTRNQKVFFWDHEINELPDDQSEPVEPLLQLADSFNEFMTKLEPYEPVINSIILISIEKNEELNKTLLKDK